MTISDRSTAILPLLSYTTGDNETISQNETIIKIDRPDYLTVADVQNIIEPLFQKSALDKVRCYYISFEIAIPTLLVVGAIIGIIVPFVNHQGFKGEPYIGLPIMFGVMFTTAIFIILSCRITSCLKFAHISKIAGERFNKERNNPIPNEFLVDIFEKLNKEQIALLSPAQLSLIMHTNWSAIHTKYIEGNLNETQNFIVDKMSILKELTATDLSDLCFNHALLEDLKICPEYKQVFFEYFKEVYEASQNGGILRSRFNLLQQELKNEPSSREIIDLELDEDDTNIGNSLAIKDNDTQASCASSSSSSGSTYSVIHAQTLKIEFNNEESLENLPKSKLQEKCRYFNSLFLDNATTINLSNIPKENFQLFLLALECPENTIDNTNIETILNIATYLLADDIIGYCMKYIANHINAFDSKTLKHLNKTASTQDCNLNIKVIKAEIQILFAEKLFETDNVTDFLKKIKQFYSIFSMPDSYVGFVASASLILKFLLDNCKDPSPHTIGKYLEIINQLPNELVETQKSNLQKLLITSLETSIVEFWDFSCKNNHRHLKTEIVKYCLSGSGKEALNKLRVNMKWYELPSEFVTLSQI